MNAEYVPGKATAEDLEKMKKIIHIEKNEIVFINEEYEIPLNKCETHAQILGWVFHLSEITWITKKYLHYFIIVACEEHKIEVPRIYFN